jgi:hypothetical protein
MSAPPRDVEMPKSRPPRIPTDEDRSIESGQKVGAYWDKLDGLFYKTIGNAERAFTINVNINIILVIVGIVLLAYSMAYSWINGLDIYSTAFAGLGVLEFITIFMLTPQRKIQKTVGDLAQIQILYRTFYMMAESVNDWDYYSRQKKTLDELKEMNNHLIENTLELTQKIEDYIGKKEKKE